MALGKKRTCDILQRLREIRRICTLETASFEDIYESQSQQYVQVRSGGVTDFIKARTMLYRESWMIDPLDQIIIELEKSIK